MFVFPHVHLLNIKMLKLVNVKIVLLIVLLVMMVTVHHAIVVIMDFSNRYLLILV